MKPTTTTTTLNNLAITAQRIFAQLRSPQDKRLCLFATTLNVISTVISFHLPLVASQAVTNPNNDGVVLRLGMLFASQHVCNTASLLVYSQVGENAAMQMRLVLFRTLVRMPVMYFDAKHQGDFQTLLGSDVDQVQLMISNEFGLLQARVFAIVGAVLGLLSISPLLALGIVCFVPLLALSLSTVGERYVYPLNNQSRQASALVLQAADETLANVRVVKAFALERFCELRFLVPLRKRRETDRKAAVTSRAFEAFIYLICAGVLSAGVKLGRGLLSDSKDLFAILGFAAQFGLALANSSRALVLISNGLYSATRVFDLVRELRDAGGKRKRLVVDGGHQK
jgi:ABC-type multidrug transport system fused ATPase/permease subunit